MKQLLIISGKGGTGKTTLAASFAALSRDKVIADCDVDASDLPLILDPEIQYTQDFVGSKIAVKYEERCTDCGRCLDYCRFDAINGNFEIDALKCEGCGTCAYVCPEGAIRMEDRLSGYSYISKTRFGPLVHAKLNPGEEASGKLVTRVKQNSQQVARSKGLEFILSDGSPGVGCPVIASLSNVDIALAVTEPTLSGIHDLRRIVGVARHFGVRTVVCINKYDLNPEMTRKIEEYAGAQGITVVGKIPYDDQVTESMVKGKSIVEYSDGEASAAIKRLWNKLEREKSDILGPENLEEKSG